MPSALRLSPLNRRRLHNFRANRRGFWSLWIFLVLFTVTLFAEFIANDRPCSSHYDGGWYFPVFVSYPETAFGGDFPTEADYRDPHVAAADRGQGLDDLAAHPLQLSRPSTTSCPCPRPPRRRARTGWAPTTRAATWWPAPSTAFASPSCSASRSRWRARSSACQPGPCRAISAAGSTSLPALHRDLVGAAGAVSAHHPGERRGAQLLVAAGADAAVQLDVAGRRGARRIPARRATSTMCAPPGRWASATRPSCSATCCPTPWWRRITFLPFILNGSDHHAHLARLPGLRAAAGLALARRAAGAGQGQPAGAVAGHHGLHGARGDAEPADLHRRGGARRLRSAEERYEPQGRPMMRTGRSAQLLAE